MARSARTVLLLLAVTPVVGLALVSASTPKTDLAEPAQRKFEFRYEVTVREVPATTGSAYLWIPYPQDTEDQKIDAVEIESERPHEVVTESRFGNKALRVRLTPTPAAQTVVLRAQVTRHERGPGRVRSSGTAVRLASDPQLWIGPDRRVPIDGKVRQWAEEAAAGKSTEVGRARAIYDYVVTNLKYDKTGTGWGNGDIYWACDAKRGNCTDFHAVFIGFNRALGLPARFEMGFPIPAQRGAGEVAGYHCWAQVFLKDSGWLPVDASEANKHPEKREYFFGSLDADRVLLTVGRDLKLPGMQGEPLNFFIYPYAEIDGKKFDKVDRKFSYRDL